LLLEQGGFDALALPTCDVGKGVNAPDHSATLRTRGSSTALPCYP
jgi:hypothetical protein